MLGRRQPIVYVGRPSKRMSNTDRKHPAIPGEIVTTMLVKGLIDRDAAGGSP